MRFRIVSIGEILFDIYPGYKCMGGAPFNFAFHLHNNGNKVAFVSRIGRDENGKEIRHFMDAHEMKTDFIESDSLHKTGEVLVHLDSKGVPSFIIREHMAYDYIRPETALLRYIESGIDLFYFGTLIQRHVTSRTSLYTILERIGQGSIILFDINLRQQFYSRKIIEKSLSVCTVLKTNDDEFQCLKELFSLKGDEFSVAQQMIKSFTITSLCVTKGSKGASLYFPNQQYHTENNGEQDNPVIDSVGAGDGFAAALAAGLLRKWPPGKILMQADRFARALCRIKGALPPDRSFYADYFPADPGT